MNKTIILSIIYLWFNTTMAQTGLTLEQCIEYAFQHKESLKNAVIDQQLADNKVSKANSLFFPQVKGTGDLKDNTLLPTTLIPGAVLGKPGNETVPVQFGQKYNPTLGIEGNWTLYDAAALADAKMLKQNFVISSENTELQKRTLRYNITLAYYEVLLAKKKIQLQEDLLNKNRLALEDAQSLFKNEQLMLLDFQKAEWNVKNQKAELQRSKQNGEQSLYLLKYQMGYPLDSVISLSVTEMEYEVDTKHLDIIPNAQNRPEYKILKLQLQLETSNKKKYRLSYIPTLSAYGYWGTQSFRPKLDFLSPSAQWYNISYMGLKLSTPIFDGFLKNRQIQESKLNEEKKSNELSAYEKQYHYEIENTKRNVANAISLLQIRKNNLEYAREQQKQTELRYKEGLSSFKDINNVNIIVSEAQNNYLLAYRDYLLAKLELERIN